MPVAGGVTRGGLPGGGSGQRRRSYDHGSDRPAVSGAALLWLAPNDGVVGTQGHLVNRKPVRRLMRLLGLVAIYQRPHTSKPAVAHKVYPYLLGGLAIERVNQVWCSDVTYIPMAKGSTRASVIARRGKFTRKACGYVDDRRCRPAALPPLPERARKAGKCSPSPTYPQAPQPTKDLILMKSKVAPLYQPAR